MGPNRTNPSIETIHPRVHQHHRTRRRRPRTQGQDQSETELHSVQKLKAALRQTRRLLAKDNIAADVRVETERRLKSLESDLRTAELQRKERELAKRYHKVKFFERRKLLRKIKKVKRELELVKAASSKEASTHLEESLFELRAQLNYVLNYPKLEKYISLFPPSKEKSERNPDLDGARRPPVSETDARREQLLIEIKSKMAAGGLSGKPELDSRDSAHASPSSIGDNQNPGRGGVFSGTRKQTSRSQNINAGKNNKADRMADDEFFDTGSESESGSSSTSDKTAGESS